MRTLLAKCCGMLTWACLLMLGAAPGAAVADEPVAAPAPAPDTLAAVAPLPADDAPVAAPAPNDTRKPAPLQLDDLPEVLPVRRTPEEEDRLQAMAMFATARRIEDDEPLRALQLYQRAFQLDPTSSTIADAITVLAFKENRADVGVRYALVSSELHPSNPLLMERLAAHLIQQSELNKALDLLNKVISLYKPEDRQSAMFVDLLMKRGRLAFILNENKLAAESFAEVLTALDNADKYGLTSEIRGALLGDAAKTYTMFGETFLKAGKLKEAREAFQTAYLVERDKVNRAFNMARVEQAEGNHEKALEELQAYFDAKATKQGSPPYEVLAEILTALGKQDEIIPRLEKLRKEDSTNLFLEFGLAQQYEKAGRWEDAAKRYDHVLQESASEPRFAFVQQLSSRKLVEHQVKQKQWADLIDTLGRINALAGGMEPVEKQLKPLLEDPEAVKALLADARRRLKEGKIVPEEQLAVAYIALEGKDYDTANQFYQSVVDASGDDSAPTYLAWGVGLLMAEQSEAAVNVFRQALDREVLPKDNPAFKIYLATALEYSGQTDEALKTINEAIKLDQGNPRLLSRRAWIYYHARQYDKAREAYEHLVKKYGDDFSSDEIRDVVREAKLVLSNIEVLTGTMPAAEEWLMQVLDEYPRDVSAHNDLGYLWADQGKHLHRALRMIQYAVNEDPENHAYRDSLGWALYRLGRYKEALPHLEFAASEESPDGVILDHLADVYLALGQKEKALEYWKRALAAFDKEQDADKIKATELKVEQHQGK